MKYPTLMLYLCCSCTTVVVNQLPGPDGSPPVDYPEAGSGDAGPPFDAVADSGLPDGGGGGLDGAEAAADASTRCTIDPKDDGICLGQTGDYYAWTCPTAKTDLPSCGEGGILNCTCVNMGVDGGVHLKCCNAPY